MIPFKYQVIYTYHYTVIVVTKKKIVEYLKRFCTQSFSPPDRDIKTFNVSPRQRYKKTRQRRSRKLDARIKKHNSIIRSYNGKTRRKSNAFFLLVSFLDGERNYGYHLVMVHIRMTVGGNEKLVRPRPFFFTAPESEFHKFQAALKADASAPVRGNLYALENRRMREQPECIIIMTSLQHSSQDFQRCNLNN